ncbi:MAG: four helix bundle protein [Bacteroidales bacterium]|nr:four helix bundle protein [Bacteroidales bacterium]
MKKKYDLEDRLIDFAVLIIKIAGKIGNTVSGKHLGGNLIRSGSSSALNYGEAQSAESRRDFIHKMKICLKELRETMVGLKIINKLSFMGIEKLLEEAMPENDELISIFVKSIDTAKKNLGNRTYDK